MTSHGQSSTGHAVSWDALFRCASIESALAEIRRQSGWPDDVDLAVDEGSLTLSGEEAGAAARVPWRVVVRGAELDAASLDQAADALAAWRAFRNAQGRTAAAVEARASDLESLHTLGRKLSECRTVEALFEVAAEVLHARSGLDAVGWAHGFSGSPTAEFLTSRPVAEEVVERLLTDAAAGLQWPPDARPVVRVRPLLDYDDEAGRREVAGCDAWAVVPLTRRSTPAAQLIVLAPEALSEADLRFVYGTANHLALHIDRVLTILEAEQGRFRSILDSMPQSVLLAGLDLRVKRANAAGHALLRRLGMGAGDAVTALGDLALGDHVSFVLDGGGARGPVEARMPSGERLELTVSPLVGEAGRVEGLVLVVADVTESRRMMEQLAQGEKLSSLGRMLSGVAHELNNPLTSVIGYAQMARTMPSGEKLERRLTVIHDEARRCQRIVQNLLRFARRHEPERKPLSLNEVAESAAALLGYQLRVDGVKIVLDLDGSLPPVHGDAHALQQVFVNLLSNAHHALRDAGRAGTVTIRTERLGDGRVAFEVRDDGPGIPDAIRSRIFDPFFTTKLTGQGTGLGLSLVYGTVASHGGTIEAGGREGEGASFRVEIPVGSPASARAEERVEPGPRDAPRVSARILVVDDERAIAEMICEALSADGHRPVAACEAGEALDRLRGEPFDLVVSDLKMPGLGAERLYDEIVRFRPALARKLLLVTGDSVSREPEAFAGRIGAELIHKPFAPDDIRRVVRTSLGTSTDH